MISDFFRKLGFKFKLPAQRGQSAVELAIVLPILLFLLLFLINIGFYLQANLEVSFAAQQGVRAGSLTNDNDKILGIIKKSLQNLRNHEKRTNVIITPAQETARHRGDELRVKVSYAYPPPFKLTLPFGPQNNFFNKDSLIIESVAVARMESD